MATGDLRAGIAGALGLDWPTNGGLPSGPLGLLPSTGPTKALAPSDRWACVAMCNTKPRRPARSSLSGGFASFDRRGAVEKAPFASKVPTALLTRTPVARQRPLCQAAVPFRQPWVASRRWSRPTVPRQAWELAALRDPSGLASERQELSGDASLCAAGPFPIIATRSAKSGMC
jgi:hypothetical protein